MTTHSRVKNQDPHGNPKPPRPPTERRLEPRIAVMRFGVPRCPACGGVVIRGEDGPVCLGCAWDVWA